MNIRNNQRWCEGTEQWFLAEVALSLWNCSNACRYFCCHHSETVLFYLVNRSQDVFNIPQHTSQLPTQRIIWSQMSIVQGWEKLGKREPYLKSSYITSSLERTQRLPWMTRFTWETVRTYNASCHWGSK